MRIHKKTPCYNFNSVTNKWEALVEPVQKITDSPSFKIVTLNVLFDKWKGTNYKHHLTRPLERYRAQFDTMQSMNAEFIVLNEVTDSYINLIKNEKWVQKHYFLSDVTGNTMNEFGNLVLSKYPISELYLKRLENLKRPIVCAKISFEKSDLVIAASHFSSLKERQERRQGQVKELTAYLDEYHHNADKIILGDVNYHSEAETPPAHYMDAWKKVNPSLPGNTFDSSINLMIHEMWPLAWRQGITTPTKMRLDRVFVQSTNWHPQKMELCFNKPIYNASQRSNHFTDIVSAFFDRFGINIFRNPKRYLFPSDHFGLVTTFHSS